MNLSVFKEEEFKRRTEAALKAVQATLDHERRLVLPSDRPHSYLLLPLSSSLPYFLIE